MRFHCKGIKIHYGKNIVIFLIAGSQFLTDLVLLNTSWMQDACKRGEEAKIKAGKGTVSPDGDRKATDCSVNIHKGYVWEETILWTILLNKSSTGLYSVDVIKMTNNTTKSHLSRPELGVPWAQEPSPFHLVL